MTEEEAYQKIKEYEDDQFRTELQKAQALRDSDILTDAETKAYARRRIVGTNLLTEPTPENTSENDEDSSLIDAMYKEDE